MLRRKRDARTATHFFRTLLRAAPTLVPRVMNVDKHAAYPKALQHMQRKQHVPASWRLRRSKYMNNLIEQDHRLIKRLVKPGLGCSTFDTAANTLAGYEV